MAKWIRYSEGAKEATWLTALLSIPLFFSVWGDFLQSEKSLLLRALSVALATAWAFKSVLMAQGILPHSKTEFVGVFSLLRTPLVAPVAGFVLSLLAATALSLDPWESLAGAATRRDGGLTQLCTILFFAALALSIRSEGQVQRIVSVAILTTVPICAYAIGQRCDMEPAIFQGSETFRVGSTLGNPVFLSAYLIMVLPLTISRILQCHLTLRAEPPRRTAALIQSVSYGALASLQVFTILATVSRGPTLGMIVGGVVYVLLSAEFFDRPRLARAALAAGLALAMAVALIAVPKSPFHHLMDVPILQRFAEVLTPRSGSSGRTAIWDMAARASRFSGVMENVDGRKDRFAPIRFLVGYGPECGRLLARTYRSKEYNVLMDEVAVLDRFHNDFWEKLLSLGAIGLFASLALTFATLQFGCRTLGLIRSTRETAVLGAYFLSGGVLGILGFISWQGFGFLGVGFSLGTILGFMAFLLRSSWRRKVRPSPREVPDNRGFLIIALLSGLSAHFTEINFSFPTETTQLYAWTYLALLLAVGYRLPRIESKPVSSEPAALDANSETARADRPWPAPEPAASKSDRAPVPERETSPLKSWKTGPRQALAGGLILGLVLVNLGAMLVLTHLHEGRTTLETLLAAFTRLAGNNNAFAWSLPGAILITALVFAWIWTKESFPRETARFRWRSFWITLAVAGFAGMLSWMVLAIHAVAALATARVTLDTVDRYLQNYSHIVDIYYGLTGSGIVLLALALAPAAPAGRSGSWGAIRTRWIVALVVAGLGFAAIYGTNMAWSKAGAMMNRADYFRNRGEWPLVVKACEASIRIGPATESQYATLSDAQLELAAAANHPNERDKFFLQGDQTLVTALQRRPWDLSLLVRRGDLFMRWSESVADSDRKTLLGRKALEFYQSAVVRDPLNHELWYRLGYVHNAILNAPDPALPFLLRSIDCHPKFHPAFALLGNLFFAKSVQAAATPGDRANWLKSAATHFQQAVTLVGTNLDRSKTRYFYLVALAKCSIQLRDFPTAIASYRTALDLSPPGDRWKNEEMLGRVYFDAKDLLQSARHLQEAIALAPADQKPALLSLQRKLFPTP